MFQFEFPYYVSAPMVDAGILHSVPSLGTVR